MTRSRRVTAALIAKYVNRASSLFTGARAFHIRLSYRSSYSVGIFCRVGWFWANDVSVPRKVTTGLPGWIFLYSARASFSCRALIWPGCFGEHILGPFGLYPSSLSKSVGFVSVSAKASFVSISAAILFLRSWHVYFPLEFEFRGKSCVE